MDARLSGRVSSAGHPRSMPPGAHRRSALLGALGAHRSTGAFPTLRWVVTSAFSPSVRLKRFQPHQRWPLRMSSGYAARSALINSSTPSITMVGGVCSNPSGRATLVLACNVAEAMSRRYSNRASLAPTIRLSSTSMSARRPCAISPRCDGVAFDHKPPRSDRIVGEPWGFSAADVPQAVHVREGRADALAIPTGTEYLTRTDPASHPDDVPRRWSRRADPALGGDALSRVVKATSAARGPFASHQIPGPRLR